MTVRKLVADAAARLARAGVESAEWDAERMLRHVLGWDRARLLAQPRSTVGAEPAERFEALLRQRESRRPLQHILGVQAFWKHDFQVTPDVLIPRPETELLVEQALRALDGRSRPVVVDVGTGSGCIALSLATELPDAEVYATEVSPAALIVAEDNARRFGLVERVRFQLGDLLAPVRGLAGRIDVVVSNPPYVDEAAFRGLAPEVRDHEPRLALVPPGEACALYRRLAPEARELLRPGGALLVEVGSGMDAEVSRICAAAGLRVDGVVPDLASIPRVVEARRADTGG